MFLEHFQHIIRLPENYGTTIPVFNVNDTCIDQFSYEEVSNALQKLKSERQLGLTVSSLNYSNTQAETSWKYLQTPLMLF